MEKQKICIIGGGLTGLVTAITLSKLNCHIDLLAGNINQGLESNRTVAISQNNYEFLNKQNIFKTKKIELWPCTKMKLYTQDKNKKISEIFEINKESNAKKVFYMSENSKIIKLFLNKMKNIKSINIKKNTIVSEILDSGLLKTVKFKNKEMKYNLVIICSGSNSNIVKNIFKKNFTKYSYEEMSVTTIVSHKINKNNTARQIFLDNEIIGLLPISNTKTSVVWSVKKNLYEKNDLVLKKKLNFYLKNYLEKIKFKTKIEYQDLNFSVTNKYFKNRILLFGDSLHTIHPLAGQGFNMTLRDLSSLEKTLSNKINLGLDIGSLDILSEFSDENKSKNFIFSAGINLVKNSFSLKNKTFKSLRDILLKNLNKSNLAKDIFLSLANKGLKF
jgi:2-octaprenyl-6-methoxyphenol hydroxylase